MESPKWKNYPKNFNCELFSDVNSIVFRHSVSEVLNKIFDKF